MTSKKEIIGRNEAFKESIKNNPTHLNQVIECFNDVMMLQNMIDDIKKNIWKLDDECEPEKYDDFKKDVKAIQTLILQTIESFDI